MGVVMITHVRVFLAVCYHIEMARKIELRERGGGGVYVPLPRLSS